MDESSIPAPAPPATDARVLLVERRGCHLCEDAHRVLDAVTATSGQRWVSVDVDSSDELLAEYGELVPVVLVDGVPRGHWRLDAAAVLAALRA
ncbi:glutaredoxin family protein [Serinibacter arcticus]|uniref:Glutaredoxin family protein n=1 Tax=Serinibacter arcticus TaxID=1655435 RepID=A0A2U1ZZN3_9MICO|nr:glutaredoxin family protein [Serinibacter arcticus]PWD52444.1 glutaredoxin family protein [Serinibacter arcticus]